MPPLSRAIVVTLVLAALCAGSAPNFLPARAVQAANSGPSEAGARPVVGRVYYADAADLAQLARSLDIWEVHPAERYLVAQLSPARHAALISAGRRVDIDPQKTARLNAPLQALPDQIKGIPGYPCYRTVDESYAALLRLASAYPALAKLQSIGPSWEKQTPGGLPGYDLLVLQLSNRALTMSKPKFFLMAEIHARELSTAELALRFAEYLLAHYGTDPEVTWLLDYQEIHILVMTNPDGRKEAETGLLWRKNTNNADGCLDPNNWGTDLNRNNGFKWGGADTHACGETYQGHAPDSEPENQAVQNYLAGLYPDRRGPGDGDPVALDTPGLFVTLHSYGDLVLWPWGWTTDLTPNATQLRTLGRKLSFFNNYTPQQATDLYPTTGTSDDWAYGKLGVAAFTFEMGDDFFQDCPTFENSIVPDNLTALLYAFKTARRPYQAPAGPDSIQVTLAITSVVGGSPVALSAVSSDTRYRNSHGSEPVQNIAAAGYSLDAPSWITGTTTYPMSATDGRFDSSNEDVRAEVDTANLAVGRHTLFVESQDASGTWGVPEAVFLWITPRSPHLEFGPTTLEQSINPGDSVTRTLGIGNSGIGPLHWQIDAQPARVWLSVTPTAGDTQPAAKVVVSVTFEAQSLPVGVYTSTLRISSDDLARPAAYIPLTLTVTSACLPVICLSFTYAPPRPFSGQAVTFSASAGGTKPVAFSWDFGDGLPGASGPSALHVFPPSIGDEEYAVTLSAQNTCPSLVAAQSPVHVQPYRLAVPVLIK